MTVDTDICQADTITKLTAGARGRVLVCGSHGGLYSGYLAATAGLRAVIFNDAGIGRDDAGIRSLDYLDRHNIAAATVSFMSCLVGDAQSMVRSGIISAANARAERLGVKVAMTCLNAAERLQAAAAEVLAPEADMQEARRDAGFAGARRIVLIDSASLVREADAGQIVVTGSHGGIIGSDPATALRTEAFAGVFNDAGFGLNNAGIGRLAALDSRGIAAFTVSHLSARIGEAGSTYESGVISSINACGLRLGAAIGDRASAVLQRWADL